MMDVSPLDTLFLSEAEISFKLYTSVKQLLRDEKERSAPAKKKKKKGTTNKFTALTQDEDEPPPPPAPPTAVTRMPVSSAMAAKPRISQDELLSSQPDQAVVEKKKKPPPKKPKPKRTNKFTALAEGAGVEEQKNVSKYNFHDLVPLLILTQFHYHLEAIVISAALRKICLSKHGV